MLELGTQLWSVEEVARRLEAECIILGIRLHDICMNEAKK